MADSGIKKVIISPEALASVNIAGDEGALKYFLRYRIVSEDKSRISAWSPIHELQARPVSSIIGSSVPTLNVVNNNNIITLTWTTPDALKVTEYDIYISWNNHPSSMTENYVYAGSVTSTKNNSFSISKLPGYNRMFVKIQVATSPKVISNSALVTSTPTAVTI
jgi:hypothetical protein